MKTFYDFYKETKLTHYIKPDTLKFDEYNGEIYSTDDISLFKITSNALTSALLYLPSKFTSNNIRYSKDEAAICYDLDEIGYVDWWDIYDILTGNPAKDEGYGLFENDATDIITEFGEMLAEYFREALDYRNESQEKNLRRKYDVTYNLKKLGID